MQTSGNSEKLPAMDVDREDVINLLLLSVALEELSLVNLLDIGIERLQLAAGRTSQKSSAAEDLACIDRSMERILHDAINLHILLQFRLEDVLRLAAASPETCKAASTAPGNAISSGNISVSDIDLNNPSAGEASPDNMPSAEKSGGAAAAESGDRAAEAAGLSQDTAEARINSISAETLPVDTASKVNASVNNTTAANMPSDAVSISDAAIRQCSCKHTLSGKAAGYTGKPYDSFNTGYATIEANINADCGNPSGCTLKYTVSKKSGKDITGQFLCAIPESIEMQCSAPYNQVPAARNPNILTIHGEAVVLKEDLEHGAVEDVCKFTLTVSDGGTGTADKFRMVITSPRHNLDHDSGTVSVSSGDLVVGIRHAITAAASAANTGPASNPASRNAAAKKLFMFGLTGSGSGKVPAGADPRFAGGIASIEEPCIRAGCAPDGTTNLSYKVTKEILGPSVNMLDLTARLDSINVQCSSPAATEAADRNPDVMVITGLADATYNPAVGPMTSGKVFFTCTFIDAGKAASPQYKFSMVTEPVNPHQSALNHNSGLVALNGSISIMAAVDSSS